MCQKAKLAQDAKKARTLDVLWALDSSVANRPFEADEDFEDFTGADAAEESDK